MSGIQTGITIEQKQTLRLSPAQLQSVEILQMSRMQLEERIRDELMENPVLEVAESISSDRDEYSDDDAQEYREEISRDELPYYDHYDDHDYWDGHPIRYQGGSAADGSGISEYEKIYRSDETLYDHLIAQLGGRGLSDTERSACEYVILSLRDDGYLDHTAEEIAAVSGHTADMINSAISIIRSLDPAGVAASSLEECLQLQLDPADELTDDVKKVIAFHLPHVASGQTRLIASSLGISQERAADIISVIRGLDPRPASHFSSGQPQQYITPDVCADIIGDSVSIYLAGRQTPLCLSSYYTRMLDTMQDAEVTEYLRDRVDKASRLIQSIEQRRSTVISVTAAILRHQSQFLHQGNRMLLPLTMQGIADELDISVSTVSRAISGKYLKCPCGTFALRHFFTAEIAGTSRDTILDRIRELIDKEDKARPLSDQKIADALAAEGLDVSRRTVAKYRDAAGILPTAMRKIR